MHDNVGGAGEGLPRGETGQTTGARKGRSGERSGRRKVFGNGLPVLDDALEKGDEVLENGGDDEGDDAHELHEDVQRGAGRVLERIADGVADDGRLVGRGKEIFFDIFISRRASRL